jgi:ribonuclease BN (tRNA processing enzyme)
MPIAPVSSGIPRTHVRLTTIGTGTAAPHAARVQSGTLIEIGDVRLLIDCGSAVVFRMASLGLGWSTLTHVAITHFHADHISDVATLIYGWRYGQLPPRTAPVDLIGPPGWAQQLDALKVVFGADLLAFPPPMAVIEMEPASRHELADGVVLEPFKVPHTDESVAYSVSGRGRRVVVSGDTGFDPGLGEWAHGCDVLVCECSLPDSLALPLHLTPRQCGTLAAIARPKQLVLTHFYAPVEAENIASQVAEFYGGPVTLAHDGYVLELEEL